MPEHWYSNSFKVGSQNAVTKSFNFSLGGFGGGEGNPDGGEWYIENVLEELDSETEWFYDSTAQKLYYSPNATSSPSPTDLFEVVTTKVLINCSGTQAEPVVNFTMKGIAIKDTAYTFLDPHGSPSGGDWSLQRTAAVMVAGTEGGVIDSSLFSRLDGIGVFITGYNRNLTISNNTFEWLGSSSIAAWGDTSYSLNANQSRSIQWPRGPDARDGNQPRGTRIIGNIVHDIGIFEKQSSFYFQAAVAQSLIKDNVHFNGPRAGINFNDGMGGGDEITENLLVNTCRESGDHGPFNSWDRAPYITTVGLNAPNASIIPQFRNIHHNFMIANYNSQEAIDNDDGSAYYNTHHNYFVYAQSGLKSDFGGHHNFHESNVYAYITTAFWGKGWSDRFINNSVVLLDPGRGYSSDCQLAQDQQVSGNSVYIKNASLNVCGTTLQKWVAAGHDNGTTIHDLPSDEALVQMGKDLLGM